MTPRSLTDAEFDAIEAAWGPLGVAAAPLEVWDDGGRARVEFDTDNVYGTLRMFIPAGADAAAVVHEVGHAVHLYLWPESAHSWSDEKCERFAAVAHGP